MGEIKSVKVDNWGVFFLQKLQNFFNKTDYCDLTLQFRDNSQLKVHRLVLSACTDYFNVLEQTCEVIDDAIIMPNGLQADVVVPIVNFMYTGTLEFELKMYNRLLRTAKDMNMTVLLKLLEAHRRTMEMHPQKNSGQSSPKPRRRTAPVTSSANAGGRSLIQTNQGKRILVGPNANTPQNRNISTSNTLTRVPTAGPLAVRQIGSTTFTRIKVENETPETSTPSSAGGGYSIIRQSTQQQQQPTSPFEQLRKGYNNNKRPAVSTFVSPPAKKPNLEDVKEFAEQQRMRKQIAAEFGDDDYDASNIMDDDTIHNDDDDDEMMTSSGQAQTSQTASAGVQTVASSSNQQQQSEDPPGTTTIIVKNEGPDKPPTIVVKDNSNTKMNHAKIISEVLRQYPHLVKGNKNIKLKIMPNAGGQSQKIIVKKDATETEKQMQQTANKLPVAVKALDIQQQQSAKTLASNIIANRQKNLQHQQPEISQVGKPNNSGTQTSACKSSTSGSSNSSAPLASGQPQKRRIDSKTMHALIALGAENTTGPWLCLRCGRNGHPISIPSYRGFRRHLINTHKETIDPSLCEHCGWRSGSKRELHFHMQLEHKVKTNLYIFPECQLCQQMCIDSDGLNQHLIESHPDENKQQCIYCNKIFPEEIQLYTHMKTFHKKQALEDGIIDYSDDENQTQMNLPQLSPVEYEKDTEQEQKETQQAKKIKILSDISLPIASSIIKTDSFVQQHELSTPVASEEYLQDQEHDPDNGETKFVAADGSEVILTAEQRKEILSQLNQEHDSSGIVMVLNDNQQQQHSVRGETQSDHGAISHDETSQATTATNEEREEDDEQQIAEEDDHIDDNQIYNEMKSLHSNLEDSTSQTDTAAEAANEHTSLLAEDQEEQDNADHEESAEHLEESKESMENLEWAENLISEHDLADEVSSQTTNENAGINNSVKKDIEIKDDDVKSQDEISKKLKELTGDWSEDDDMSEEEPVGVISSIKENVKEKEEPKIAEAEKAEEEGLKEHETNSLDKKQEDPELDDHAELLASLQSTDKDEAEKQKNILEQSASESENIDEDDIDMALKSLHKEDVENDDINKTEKEMEKKLSNDTHEEKESSESTEFVKETVQEVTKPSVKNEDGDTGVFLEAKKDIEIKKEKQEDNPLTLREPEKTNKSEESSSRMEVDEKTKKDLIDSLLSEQAKIVESPATEILTTSEAVKLELATAPDGEQDKIEHDAKAEDKPNLNEVKVESQKNPNPEKEENLADNISKTITPDAIASTTTRVFEASSSGVKEQTTLSSEERVKNLISEWGDDEDEDENDTDLPANL